MAMEIRTPPRFPECGACHHRLTDGESARIVGREVVHIACEGGFRRRLEAAAKGLAHRCPKCAGDGRVLDVGAATDPFDRRMPEVVSGTIICELCHGHGYLAKPAEPVMGVVDWKVRR